MGSIELNYRNTLNRLKDIIKKIFQVIMLFLSVRKKIQEATCSWLFISLARFILTPVL